MVLVATGPRIVGREKSSLTAAIVELSQVGSTRDDVVSRVIRICTQPVAESQLGPGLGHDLHQAHGAFGRQSAHIAKTFRAHDGANPGRWNQEPPRCFGDKTRERIRSNSNPLGIRYAWFGIRDTDADEQHDSGRTAPAEPPDIPHPSSPSANGGGRYGRNGGGHEPLFSRRRGAVLEGPGHGQSSSLIQSGAAGRRWSSQEA